MNEFLPLLYLKGISTNDFADALTPLFGENAKNLSPGVISRLKVEWEDVPFGSDADIKQVKN